MFVLVFIIWRLVDIIVAFLIPKLVHYLGNFSYPKDLLQFGLPKTIYSFANFDGVYYLRIAKLGYQQYEQAFFPLYPLLISFFSLFLKRSVVRSIYLQSSFFSGISNFFKIFKTRFN
jgi:hypothetical protein